MSYTYTTQTGARKCLKKSFGGVTVMYITRF